MDFTGLIVVIFVCAHEGFVCVMIVERRRDRAQALGQIENLLVFATATRPHAASAPRSLSPER